MDIPQQGKKILLLEAFYGGSHKQLADYLKDMLIRKGHTCDCITMTDKKWHWRMRTSSLYFAQKLNQRMEEDINLSYE